MEAGTNSTADGSCIRYEACTWGDWITGTKEQLQALGLGAGLAFPGEAGAPKRCLVVQDPRGFEAEISQSRLHQGAFTARIIFPGWPVSPRQEEPCWLRAFDGVECSKCAAGDSYRGSADSLVAAGLVPPGHFPGLPGMRKVRVTILPDGTTPTGPLHARHPQAWDPGARYVERAAGGRFVVHVQISDEEQMRRRVAERAAVAAYEARMLTLPRPEKLTDYARGIVDQAGARGRGSETLAAMGMLHRRKLPPGWRVIEGHKRDGATA